VYALSSAIPLAERLDNARVQEQILPSLKAASANKQSWRLRFAAAESAAFIARHCNTTVVDAKIVPMYVSLLGDSEAEVRSESASKLVELCSHCSSNLIVTRVLPQLKLQLATESSQHVKGSMAIAVCEMAKKLEQADADKHLIPMISILLKNNSTEVVVSLVTNLGPVVEKLGAASI
jgi:serine/threonine-protein phosphatase 2A regulatory subunit A